MSDLTPARSATEPPTTPSPNPLLRNRDRAQSYLHRRLHSTTTSNHHSSSPNTTSKPSHLQRAKDHVQSAIELKPPISFDHVLRRDKKSQHHQTRHRSHTDAPSQQDLRERQAQQLRQRAEEERQRAALIRNVAVARAENRKRGEVLRQRLDEIEKTSMTYTQRLDETYYDMLEKASELQNTIGQLQTLLESTKTLGSSFEAETQDISREMEEKMAETTSVVEKHEQVLEGLVERLQGSQERVETIDERLARARKRVAEHGEMQTAIENKRRKQWNATWISSIVVLLIILVILILHHRQSWKREMRDLPEWLGVGSHKWDEAVDEVRSHLARMVVQDPKLDGRLDMAFDEL